MGYLVEALWLQIPLSVIWATKKVFVFALSLWCYKPVQSMAHHFVAFMHHARFNILISVTLKKTVFWNLQPATWYSCTDLRDCMASHPRFIFVMKLLCRHLTKLLGCNNIPLQGLYMTTQMTKTYNQAPGGIRTHHPSVWGVQNSTTLNSKVTVSSCFKAHKKIWKSLVSWWTACSYQQHSWYVKILCVSLFIKWWKDWVAGEYS